MHPARRRPSRRGFCGGLAIAALGVATACAAHPPESPTAEPTSTPQPVLSPPPTVEKLLVSGNGNFYAYDLATRQATQVTHYAKNSFGAAPTLSADRNRVAYTFYVVPTNVEDVGGSDLYVMDTNQYLPQLVLSAKALGGSVETPSWATDGKSIDVTLRISYSGANRPIPDDVTVYRISLDGNKPIKLVDRAHSPALSSDGRSLAYVGATTNDVWLTDTDARKVRRVVDGAPYDTLRFLRFAPSGEQIVFAASLKGTPAAPVKQGMANPFRLLLDVPIAEADHGAPWEIWSVRTDGTGLRQLSHMSERTPVPAWSPDGRWLAIDGGNGVSLVEVATGQATRLAATVYGGGIVWLS